MRALSPVSLVGAVTLLLAGCGSGERTTQLDAVVPLQLGLVCLNQAALTQNLQATLSILGHPDCLMNVNPGTGAASGVCPDIKRGAVWPLLLTYLTPLATGQLVPIAYNIGAVDLREEALQDLVDDDPPTKAVVLGTGSDVLLVREQQVNALPEADHGNSPIDSAKVWAKRKIRNSARLDLDVDVDGCPNVLESCNGTLDDPTHLSTCP